MGELTNLTSFLFNGLHLGAYYAIVAAGVAIVFGVLEVGDVAQGGLFTLGAYLTYSVTSILGLNYFLAPILVVPVTASVSVFFGVVVYRKLRDHGIAPTFLGAVSLLIVLQSLLATAFGERAKTVSSPLLPRTVKIGQARIFSHKLFVIFASLLLAFLVWYWLKRTRQGKSLRAVAGNREAASLVGVDPKKAAIIGFGVAGGLSGLAGFLTAPVYPITPFAGRLTVLKAFVISRLALGSVPAVVGLALVIGLAESLASGYFLGELSNLIPFLLLVVVALARPDTIGPEERYRVRNSSSWRIRLSLPGGQSPGWLIGAGAFALPFLFDLPSYFFHLSIMTGTSAMVVTGVDLVYGYVGTPTLVHGALFGVGAYTSALLTGSLGSSVFISLVAGILASGLAGVLIGVLGVRTGRHWTSFTFIMTIVFTIVVTNLESITGGVGGVYGIPELKVGFPGLGWLALNPFQNKESYYLLVLGVLSLVLLLKRGLLASWFGRALRAIRENEVLAESVGIPVDLYRVGGFTISAGIAGAAGSLFAHYVAYIHPELFNFITSFEFLLMNRVGGIGSVVGPILGSTSVLTLEELTKGLSPYLGRVVTGILLILTLIYLPGGALGFLKRVSARFLPDGLVRFRGNETELDRPRNGDERGEGNEGGP